MMEKKTVEVDEPGQKGIYHIPGVHNMQNTLCGFVDVIHEFYDYKIHPCNCELCIDGLDKIKRMKFPKGYFKK